MNNIGCEHCDEVCRSFNITKPSDLSKAIRVISGNIADGTIQKSTYWPSKHIKVDSPPFEKLEEEGPWKDFLEYYFECPKCDQVFRLSAETYHGSGGGWEPVERTGL